jgi:hypothetical protein
MSNRKSIELKLTRAELEHIRDMMSVMVAKTRTKTLSVLLSEHKNSTGQEARLWKKILELCDENSITVGKDAPDYLVGVINNPTFAMITLPSDDG